MFPRTNPEFRLNLLRNPLCKIRRRAVIHRNNNRAANRTPKKRSHPPSGISAPEHDPIALAYSVRVKLAAEPKRHFPHLSVGEPLHAIPEPLPIGTLLGTLSELGEEEFC